MTDPNNPPIEPRFKQMMRQLAQNLDEIFNGDKKGADKETGFALFIFPFKEVDGPRVNYISNGSRQDMIAAMEEWIQRAKGELGTEEHVQ